MQEIVKKKKMTADKFSSLHFVRIKTKLSAELIIVSVLSLPSVAAYFV